jgi:dTDP-4-amino-4,6-dideoxygalactose transaminase
MVAVAPDAETRQAVAGALREAGMQTSLHYPCITEFTAFENYAGAPVPHSRAYARRTISLPMYPGLREEDVAMICAVITGSAHA